MSETVSEIRRELTERILPFWRGLRDDERGGYTGQVEFDLTRRPEAERGCILNSRILWFFSEAYLLLREPALLDEAKHAYEMLCKMLDREHGGVYWSMNADGTVADSTKHTYNQAFSIYALSSYYDASKDETALAAAMELFHIIEERCTDEIGYKEAFDREFHEIENDKLSENGVIADKTMNTLLHVFEAYTELYRVSGSAEVKKRLEWILDTIADKIYNPKLHRQEVFFDREMHSILDLHSYGHDIETAWLLRRGTDVLGDKDYEEKMLPIILDLTGQVYRTAFDGRSLANECEKGVVDENRIWWVQAEAVIGFLNGYQLAPEHKEYLDAAKAEWAFIKAYVIDNRPGAEWFWDVNKEGEAVSGKPIVEPWKCPYHNGRMCLEVCKRGV